MPSLSDKEAQKLAKFYSKVEKEIKILILKALLKGNQTEYLKSIEKNIKEILAQLEKGSNEWCKKSIPRLYLEGTKIAEKELKAMGITDFKAGFGAIHQTAVQALAQSSLTRLEPIGSVIGRRVADIFRDLQLEAAKGQVVGYNTWVKTAQIYRSQLAEHGITGFVDRSGRKWNMAPYTKMVGRTVAMEANVAGTANRYLENGYDLVEVTKHSKPCDKCKPFEGKILSLTGKTKGYTTLAEARSKGLFHPNCRHDLTLHVSLD